MNPIESRTEDEWRASLSPEEYRVLRERGTELPGTGVYLDEKRPGIYRCKACGADLFSSADKFDSGSGWPSFTKPGEHATVGTRADDSHGMHRTEVFCTNCGGHLGHVFPDGPKEQGGLRYCINSVSLDLDPKKS